MPDSEKSQEVPRSYFARKLAANPEFRAQCEEVANAVRETCREDIEAGERSEMITGEDLATVINAKAPQFEYLDESHTDQDAE